MNQLSLVFANDTDGSEQQTFSRFLMFHHLDTLYGKTALLNYANETMDIALPFEISDLGFNPLSKQLNLSSIISSSSKICFQHTLESITNSNGIITAVYQKRNWKAVVPKGKERPIIEGIPGRASIELAPFERHKMPTRFVQHDCFQEDWLIDRVVQLNVRIEDDWISELVTLPIKIASVTYTCKTIEIKGTQGERVFYKNVVGIRQEDQYSLVDIREPNGRMSCSFVIWYTKPTH